LERETTQAPAPAELENFNHIYERYARRIYAFAFSKLRNQSDCEDAVQETFVAVFQSFDKYEGRASLQTWIYGVARNVINNQIRRSQAEGRLRDNQSSSLHHSEESLDTWTPEQSLGLRRCTDAVEDRLKALTDWQAKAFEMRHFDDHGIDEIADKVERSSCAVRSGLYRAKKLVHEAVYPS